MVDLSWQAYSKAVIAEITSKIGIGDPDVLERAIRVAYPFGARAHWPYRGWLKEVRRHLAVVRDRKGVGLPKETGPLFQEGLF